MQPYLKPRSRHDWFYRAVGVPGRFAMWATSRALVIDAHHARRATGFILASSHFSVYDIPCLMRAVPRRLDFVSIVEAFDIPWVAWFFSRMNAFPLDRHHTDSKAVRVILDRLQSGRVIAMFPEGGLRTEETSVVNGGKFRPGAIGLARVAGVPVVPAVVCGSKGYGRLVSFLPLRTVRYGVIFGEPIDASDEAAAVEKLRAAYPTLYKRLREAMSAQPS